MRCAGGSTGGVSGEILSGEEAQKSQELNAVGEK
jgi:hypothetical protein